MSGPDDDLLARLNALKPSSVSLDSAPKASVDVQSNEPQTVEDRLADRLKALRAGGKVSPVQREGLDTKDDALTSKVRDEIATEADPIRDWQQNGENEQSLDDLIAEIGPDDQWKPDPDDPKHVASLLREAKEALPPQDALSSDAAVTDEREQDDWVKVDTHDDDRVESEQVKTEDQRDEEEANEYVTRVLAELDIEKKYGRHEVGEKERDAHDESETASQHPDLPSTPSNLPSTSAPPTYEDSELEARFSKLGLDLPSTPSAPPSAKLKPKVTARLSGSNSKKSNLPRYTDEDIESWCCICNEDGEVKCLGCDDDIYCQNCWREGHGTGPGQERGHRAVQFVRKGGGDLAAA